MGLARLTVDLAALRANYRQLAADASRVAAVVKADGYGLGAPRVAQALTEGGCSEFFVATVDEGLALADHVGGVRIYVFSGPVDASDAARFAERGLTPVLNDKTQLDRWRPYRHLPVAVHVDTGMNRLGFDDATLQAAAFDGFDVAVVLSHLANADEPTHSMNARQVERFEVARAMFPNARTSLGNSAGTLAGIASDLSRPGIALYGGNPFSSRANPMRPVATLEARVVGLRDVRDGEPVGYGGTFTAAGETRIAVLGMGYADGIPRQLAIGAEVAYRGTRLPVVARVSMDLTHVDATAVAARIAVGDWVEVFGHTVGVDETAAWASTISYEVLTRIGTRVARRYTNG